MTTATASGKGMIVIWATTTASAQIATLAGVSTPVLTTNPGFLDELGMAGTGGNQGSTGSPSDVVISTAAQSHMLGAGNGGSVLRMPLALDFALCGSPGWEDSPVQQPSTQAQHCPAL